MDVFKENRIDVEDRVVTLNGMKLAMRVWNPRARKTILALHGWLDNLASFDVLSPLLPGYRVIAVDLPGHGESDHRPENGTYNIWDDLPVLVALLDSLGVDEPVLLGHSRGAAIATLLAAVLGERVSQLVLLDAVAPFPNPPRQFAQQLRRFVEEYSIKPAKERLRVFATLDDAVAARRAVTSIDYRAARPIVRRNLESCADGWRWRTDPRLRFASAYKMSSANIASILGDIRAPGLLIRASAGFGRQKRLDRLIANYRDLCDLTVEGEHHWHLLDAAPVIADHILGFLET